MKLHYRTNQEYASWPENVQKGAAGLGMPNVSAFISHCNDLIATHWTVTDEMKAKTLQLAEKMLNKEYLLGIKLLKIGGQSSYAQWYTLIYDGEIYTFGLNTPIDRDYLNSFEWAV